MYNNEMNISTNEKGLRHFFIRTSAFGEYKIPYIESKTLWL
jgi:hypothetical protein